MAVFKLIKKGTYAFKREGPRVTSYRVRFRAQGVHLEQPLLGVTCDQDAIKEARKLIGHALNRANQSLPGLTRIREIGAEVISQKLGSTQRDATFWIEKRIVPWCDAHCPFVERVTEATWEDFVRDYLRVRPGQKLFNCRKYFRQIMRRAHKKRLINRVPDLPIPDRKRSPGKVYTDQEMSQLLTHARPTLKLQILMGFACGMRRKEILSLSWDCIDWEAGTISLKAEMVKTRFPRRFKVPQSILEALAKRKTISKSDYVFPSPTDWRIPVSDNKSAWQACKDEADVVGRFHDLRHTFLTNAVHKHKSAALDICKYAGLSVEEMDRTYLHPTVEDTAYLAQTSDESIKVLEQNLGKVLVHGEVRDENSVSNA
jgi:integrase